MIFTSYLFTPGGGKGTFATSWHFPMPLLLAEPLPITRPEASRWVACEPLVVSLPVSLPEASRNWVLLPDPLPVRVSALPAERPLASL